MTWSANLTVDSVERIAGPEGSPLIEVTASVSAGDTYRSSYEQTEYPALLSNTEGQLRSVLLKLRIDADATRVQVGDLITAHGHFEGAPIINAVALGERVDVADELKVEVIE